MDNLHLRRHLLAVNGASTFGLAFTFLGRCRSAIPTMDKAQKKVFGDDAVLICY